MSSGSITGSRTIGVGGVKSSALPHGPHLPRWPLGLAVLVVGGGTLIFTLLIVTTLMTIAGVGGVGGAERRLAAKSRSASQRWRRRKFRRISARLPAGGTALPPRLGDPRGDRQGRVRPWARPRPIVHEGGGGQLSRRGRADAVPGGHVGDVWRGRRRRREGRSLGSGRRDHGSRELPARLGRARQLQESDLRVQPRGMVRGRGRGMGDEVSRLDHGLHHICPNGTAGRRDR